jgi:hypothetical protein
MNMIDLKKMKQDAGENPQNEIQLDDEWIEGTEYSKRKSNPLSTGIDEEYLAI